MLDINSLTQTSFDQIPLKCNILHCTYVTELHGRLKCNHIT